jgi:hypothetical protein
MEAEHLLLENRTALLRKPHSSDGKAIGYIFENNNNPVVNPQRPTLYIGESHRAHIRKL